MLENKEQKNKKNKVLTPTVIALSLYCGGILSNNRQTKNVHADTVKTVLAKENKSEVSSSQASSAAPSSQANSATSSSQASSATSTSQASSAAPSSQAISATSNSQASSATSNSQASSATQTSQASSATSSSQASSVTTTNQASQATPSSQASSAIPSSQASSATPTSQTSSATPSSQANSAASSSQANSAASSSQANSAAPTSQANSVAPTSQASSLKHIEYDKTITPYGVINNAKLSHSLFTNFAATNNAISLYSEGNNTVPSRSIGVDVSNYQSSDLSSFARRGAKYAIVKVTEGTGYVNPVAGAQISSAARNGMQVQVYHFAHFGGNSNEAIAEANFAISKARQFGVPAGSYLACDYETDASGSVAANTNAVTAFMNQVANAGYKPLLYSGAYYMRQHLNTAQIVNRFGNCLWVAAYPTTAAVSGPDFNYFPSMNGVIMWQFSDNLWGMSVDGDVNVLPMTSSGSPTVNNTQGSSNNSSSSNTSNEPTWVDNLGDTWHKETGIFTVGDTPLHLRWGATTSSTVITLLQPGQKVEYDAWMNDGTYTWVRQPRGNGTYGYVAVRDKSGPFGTFSDVPGSNNNNNNNHPAPAPQPAQHNNFTGQKQVNGKWQYWNNGQPVKNNYQWIGDEHKECYYDGNGNMVYGEQNINGHWQYFDPKTGAQAKNTFINLPDGRSVYYDGNGNMVYGQQNVWGANRYFDPVNGNEAKNKFITVNGQTYYYGPDGSMVYGNQTINGKQYTFNSKTGVLEKQAPTDGNVTITPSGVDYGNGQGEHSNSNSVNSTLPSNNTPVNNTPAGNTSVSNTPTGNIPTGNTSVSNTPTGNIPTGNTPVSNTSTSNTSSGYGSGSGITPSLTINNANGTTGTISAGNTQIGANSDNADVSANYHDLIPGTQYTLTISMKNPNGTPAGSKEITFTPTQANGTVNVNIPLAKQDITNGISALKPSLSINKVNADQHNLDNTNKISNDIKDNQQQASHITGNGMGLGVTNSNNATSNDKQTNNTPSNTLSASGNAQAGNDVSGITTGVGSGNNEVSPETSTSTINTPVSNTETSEQSLIQTDANNNISVGAVLGMSLSAMLTMLGTVELKRKKN